MAPLIDSLSNSLLGNMVRLTHAKRQKFKEMTGKDIGETLNDIGITSDSNTSMIEVGKRLSASMKMADSGLENVRGTHRFTPVSYEKD